MSSKKIRKSKFKISKHKKLLFSSIITMGILCPSNVVSNPLTNPNFKEVNKYSKKSFITKAIEKTGSSVVTIETQKYVIKFPEILKYF